MSVIWSRIVGPNGPSLSVIFPDGEVVPVGKDHASFREITQLLLDEAPEEQIRALLNPVKSIITRFQRLSERVTTDGVNLFFDGDVLHDSLADYILKLIREESEGNSSVSWRPFVNFLEKLAQNPSQESRESLFDFVTHWGLTIRENGDFIAYKGVQDDFRSRRSGPAIVNNVRMNGYVPNKPGNLIEIERSYVDADRSNACGQGLHAGTYDYASWWGTKIMAVAINPRDVVAVPRNEVTKLRVSRYEVLTEAGRKETPKATAGAASASLWSEAPVADEKSLKRLRKALKNGEFLKIEYKGKSYIAKPRSIDGSLVKVALDDRKSYRSFRVENIDSVKKLKEPKKGKRSKPAKQQVKSPKKAKVAVALSQAIVRGAEATLSLKNGKSLVVKPRRLVDGAVAVTIPSKSNKFKKIELDKIEAVSSKG